MSLNETPLANRLHIGLFGRRNSGKSSLLNALTGQQAALVSDTPGTTTDPVYKAMELAGAGPVVFIDTAGFDDVGELGGKRVGKTRLAAEKTDIALLLFAAGDDWTEELRWVKWFQARKTPLAVIVSRVDERADAGAAAKAVEEATGLQPLCVSVRDANSVEAVRQTILRLVPEEYDDISVTGGLARPGDTVLLVMPQDIQAPKGRLILPQVQTIRDLLEKSCVVVAVTTAALPEALARLKEPPALIITDSQAFAGVYAQKPRESRLTSFSVLFAAYKGDIEYYAASAEKLDELPPTARVLIAEACTHKPLDGDIGRIKIPAALKKRLGPNITIDVRSGNDFPRDLTPYDLVIHCGGCMFNRRYVLSRVADAKAQGVPMTNYGILLAKLAGILDKIELPAE
ncbi:MAG: [Schwartzia sp.]|nr:[FeFe] hydrogenase H-cluster maturation GTPase HydF [Schwartzia sp. (in: firmicutes)]